MSGTCPLLFHASTLRFIRKQGNFFSVLVVISLFIIIIRVDLNYTVLRYPDDWLEYKVKKSQSLTRVRFCLMAYPEAAVFDVVLDNEYQLFAMKI